MEVIKAFNTNDLHTEIVIKGTPDDPLFRASDVATILEIGNIRPSLQNFDDSEKVIYTMQTQGGMQDITFLTEKGLYKVLFKSRKTIAETFQNWVCEVIKEIRIKGKYDLEKQLSEKEKQLEEQNKIIQEKEEKLDQTQKLLEETEKMKSYENNPHIYIYNIDTTKKEPELKIGYSMNVHQRIKPYKQVCKHGKIELCISLLYKNVKTIENYIHSVFSDYRISDEVFKISVEEAKIVVLNIIDMFNIMKISNTAERQIKLKQIVSLEEIENKTKVFTCEVSCQTNFDESENVLLPSIENDIINKKIIDFIKEYCIIRSDVEIRTKDIVGQFRLWCREAKKELSKAFINYLDTHFKYSRLSLQDKNQVVNGYIGITLKEILYKKDIVSTDVENFIFQICQFTPGGTILNSTLFREYENWKKSIGKTYSSIIDNASIHDYLKKSPHVLYETIWAKDGGGQGYYGLCVKTELNHHRNTSTTGKKVEKRQKDTNALLGTWETIAKAAIYENVYGAKLSRFIKNKTIINDDYYYCH